MAATLVAAVDIFIYSFHIHLIMGIKVISLFDGMSCGQIAFKQLGIDVDQYDAWEIDKYAVKVTDHNFPNTIQHGDVFSADFTQFKGRDWLVGGSPCFTAGHMVLTDVGYKPIEDIQVGDMVLTHKNRFRKVLAVGSKVAPVCKVKVGSCIELIGTDTHPFPVRNQTSAYNPKTRGMIKALGDVGRVELKDLKKNESHLAINQIQTEVDIDSLSDEELWMFGRYIADGHCRKSKRKGRVNSYHYAVIISVGANKVEDFKAHTSSLNPTIYPHTKSTYRACMYSQKYVELIESYEMGKCSCEKTIPYEFLNLPKNRLKCVLEGYFSGDGCKIKNGMMCTTVSKELALSLQMAILKVYGVNANISMPNIKSTHVIEGRTVNQKPQYVITFHYTNSDSTRCRMIDNQMWFPVTELSGVVGEDVVYNMTVDEDHSYTVNNVCAFNCTYWSIAQSPDKRERE